VSLKINRRGGEGITVPYALIFDRVRKNRGFKDVRGRPDIAAEIAEGIDSRALGECLVRIARENLRDKAFAALNRLGGLLSAFLGLLAEPVCVVMGIGVVRGLPRCPRKSSKGCCRTRTGQP
jgi:hypothetical protein